MQLGRPGQVGVDLELDEARLAAVRISGAAIIVSEGRLAI